LRGTIAPFKYQFLEVGLDAGFVSGAKDWSYYSFCPFVHYAFFYPITVDKVALYAGLGAGYFWANYNFSSIGELKKNSFAADVFAGVNLFNMLDISYTLRTSFKNVSNKISVGYTYRFK